MKVIESILPMRVFVAGGKIAGTRPEETNNPPTGNHYPHHQRHREAMMADGKNTDMAEQSTRYELRTGRWGQYFHDTNSGGFDMPLDIVLMRLNRSDEYARRLAKANKGRKNTW